MGMRTKLVKVSRLRPTLYAGLTRGHLTLVKRISPGNWECACDCGQTVVKSAGLLREDYPYRSCGCVQKPPKAKKVKPVKTPRTLITLQPGEVFGRLTVVETLPGRWVQCVCVCGNSHTTRIDLVRSGKCRSCGCLRREARHRVKHRMSHSPEFISWSSMRRRCLNPNNRKYKNYGGRGIKICPRWDDFRLFYEDMGPRPPGTTLDRKDVNGDYTPDNCRWADRETQDNNRTDSHWVTGPDGRRQTVAKWCRELGLNEKKVRYRIKTGEEYSSVFWNINS